MAPEMEIDQQEERGTLRAALEIEQARAAELEEDLALGRIIRIFLCIEIVFLCGIILGMLAGKEEIRIWTRPN